MSRDISMSNYNYTNNENNQTKQSNWGEDGLVPWPNCHRLVLVLVQLGVQSSVRSEALLSLPPCHGCCLISFVLFKCINSSSMYSRQHPETGASQWAFHIHNTNLKFLNSTLNIIFCCSLQLSIDCQTIRTQHTMWFYFSLFLCKQLMSIK